MAISIAQGQARASGLHPRVQAATPGGDGSRLSLETDALFVRTASDDAEDLAAVEADASRLRFGLEASRVLATD